MKTLYFLVAVFMLLFTIFAFSMAFIHPHNAVGFIFLSFISTICSFMYGKMAFDLYFEGNM